MTWKTNDRTSIRKIGDLGKLQVIDFGDRVSGLFIMMKAPRVFCDDVESAKRGVEIEVVRMAQRLLDEFLPSCSSDCDAVMDVHQFVNNDADWMSEYFKWVEIGEGVWVCPDCRDDLNKEKE